MNFKLLLLSICLFALPVAAQTFSGMVTDTQNQPVPYASLYLRENQSGVTTNINGSFKISLPVGDYTCDVSCLGYTTTTWKFHQSISGTVKTFQLAERVYSLNEVSVHPGGEDPAYRIIRMVIAASPYYQNQIKAYSANIYVKGTGKLVRIPGILNLSKDVRNFTKKYKGKLLVIEQQREVNYKSPKSYKVRLLANKNSFPEQIKIGINPETINLYDRMIFDKLSPIAPGAFHYYKYVLICTTSEGKHTIYKIQVIPRHNETQLLSGYIYIVDDLWCVSACDMLIADSHTVANLKVSCQEVNKSVFMPVSVSSKLDIHGAGFQALASVTYGMRYRNVIVNKQIRSSVVGIDRKEEAVNSTIAPADNKKIANGKRLLANKRKYQKKIEELTAKLNNKGDLSKREIYELSRLSAKLYAAPDSLQSKHRFERLTPMDLMKVSEDSLANSRDSAYWDNVRTAPLLPEEEESYAHLITKKKEKEKSEDKKDWSDVTTWWNLLVHGNKFESKDGNKWFRCYDFTSLVPEFNFVDGFWVGYKFSLGTKLSKATSLEFSPAGYYATARHKWIGKGKLAFNYAPRRQGRLMIEGGSLTADYNEVSGESRFFDAVSALIYADNYIKLYNRQYLTLSNKIEPANGLLFTSSLSWERRTILENSLHHSLLGQNAEINHPLENTSFSMPENRLLKASFDLEFTPSHYYRMDGNRKVYDQTNNPTFTLGYSQAFDTNSKNLSSQFSQVRMGVRQKIDVGLFNHFTWGSEAGTFFNRKDMQFPDYYHFPTVMNTSSRRSFCYGFTLLDCYTYSTDNRWAMMNMTWETPYLLVKYLPFLRMKSFDEAIHVRALASGDRHPYLEVGYSVGVEEISRVGLFLGFDHTGYRSIGISLSFPLLFE
jgi:hypothetical protein